VIPEHIKGSHLTTEEVYLTYGPNIAGFATKIEGSKRDIRKRI